jgi:hypothetical protein
MLANVQLVEHMQVTSGSSAGGIAEGLRRVVSTEMVTMAGIGEASHRHESIHV